MTVDKTEARATNKNELVERIRDRILPHGSLNSSHQSRKPPGMEGKCMRCGKTRPPARTEMSS